MSYYVYILECSDSTLYVGSTNNVEKRLHAHNFSKTGARYTRGRRPVVLRHVEDFETKSEALKREIELKKWTRAEKMKLIADHGIITVQDQ